MPILNKIQTVMQPPQFKHEISLDLEDLMESCECFHLDTGHTLLIGDCGYDNCDCKQFKAIEFSIIAEITNADIFESENPDHSERGSLYWESEFDSWRKINDGL